MSVGDSRLFWEENENKKKGEKEVPKLFRIWKRERYSWVWDSHMQEAAWERICLYGFLIFFFFYHAFNYELMDQSFSSTSTIKKVYDFMRKKKE